MKLLKVVISFIALVSLQIAAAQWLHVPPPVEAKNLMMFTTGVPVAGGVCTKGSGDNWENTDYSDGYTTGAATDDIDFQKVANTGSKDICKVVVRMSNPAENCTETSYKLKSIDFLTTYGESEVKTLLDSVGEGPITYNFSPAVTVPGDFVVTFQKDAACGRWFHSYNQNEDDATERQRYFGGSSYNATVNSIEHAQDWTMEIWYIQ